MIKGIKVNGKHSYHSFGLRMLKRSVGAPPKDEHLERVPYSNVTYDFDVLYGRPSYGERTLSYQFELMELRLRRAEDKIVDILGWLHWSGRLDLYDDMLPGFHFQCREPSVSYTADHGVYVFTVVFKAAPAMLPNPGKQKYNVSTIVLPDVTEDGRVDSADSSAILQAYAAISTGEDPGLSESQLDAADANRDGMIDSGDSSWVYEFYANFSTGEYGDMSVYEAWAAFMNEKTGNSGGVY